MFEHVEKQRAFEENITVHYNTGAGIDITSTEIFVLGNSLSNITRTHARTHVLAILA